MRRFLALGLIIATPLLAQQTGNESGNMVPDVFPAGLVWERIEGAAREVDTRFGVITIEQAEQCPGTREPALQFEIKLDGDVIQPLPCLDGDYYIVLLKNSYVLGAMDVVILGADAGGSGSPPQRLHLIVLDSVRGPRIEMDPAFRSVDGTERVALADDRLWFDLGYDTGERKSATFDQNGLRIDHVAVVSTPVPRAICQDLYSGALSDCIFRARGTRFAGDTFPQFMETPGLTSTASRNQLRAISHHPGFSGEGFLQACLLATQSGETPSYETFRSTVCVP